MAENQHYRKRAAAKGPGRMPARQQLQGKGMAKNRYDGIRITDIPFDVFSLFSRGNQSVHAGVLLLTAGLCANDIEGAVQYDVLVDEIKKAGYTEGRGDGTVLNPENTELNILKGCRLLRRQSRYDQAERRWVDYVYMTGRGQKVADFLVSISQTDIQQTKEANIQGSLLSMREAASDSPSAGIILYDALKAAHEGILDLVTHLSSFSGSFRDFIEENTAKIETAAQAREWISTMFHSRLLTEYFTIVDTAYVYSAKLGEIRGLAEKLQERHDLTERIIDREYERRKDVAEKTHVEPVREEIERDVITRIRRLKEMTDFEYHNYMSVIQVLVDEVIQRVYFVMASFGLENDNSSVIDILVKLVRYASVTGNGIPPSISNLYGQRTVDGGSLRRYPSRNSQDEQLPVEEPDTDVFSEADSVYATRKENTLEMARALIRPGEKTGTDAFPCRNMEEYLQMFILAGYADKENNPLSEFDFTPDGTQVTKGMFILPGGYYRRDAAPSGAQENMK